jgi:uncharacterized protein involved in propanediol utilization
MMTPECYGRSNGTLGELFQGSVIHNEKKEVMIISVPIELGSVCSFYKTREATDPFVFLENKEKTIKTILNFLRSQDLTLPNGFFQMETYLPIGKGMGSSTADIISAIRCLTKMFKLKLTLDETISLIEEDCVDAIMFSGFNMFLSRKKKLLAHLPSSVNFRICYVEEDYTVETDEYPDHLYRSYCLDGSSLEKIKSAFAQNMLLEIGAISTESARNNQLISPKKNFDLLIKNYGLLKSCGIVVAHTGSIIGLLFPENLDIGIEATVNDFFKSHNLDCKWISSNNITKSYDL